MNPSTLAAVCLCCGTLSAQGEKPEVAPPPVFRGTYYAAAGVFVPAAPGDRIAPGSSNVIYNNTEHDDLFALFADGSAPGTVFVDEGRVPTRMSGVGATQASYTVTAFEIAYCTRRGASATVNVIFYEKYVPCATLASTPPPIAIFNMTGLPGSGADGTLFCNIVRCDLTGGREFCIRGDADGSTAGTVTFGYGLNIVGETFGPAGFPYAGDPATCAPGEGTYYQSPPGCDGSGSGTGLGDVDVFRREGPMSGCEDGGAEFASLYMALESDLAGDCRVCPSDDPFEGNDACATPRVLPGEVAIAGLTANDEDYYSILVPFGNRLIADVYFSHAQANLEAILYAPACSRVLDASTSDTDDERIRWLNDTGADLDVILRVFSNDGISCGDYDLDLDLVPDPCLTAEDDALEPNDTCAEAARVGPGHLPDLFVRVGANDWFEITVPPFETLYAQALFEHADGNLDLGLYDACGGTLVAASVSETDNEQVVFENASPAAVALYLNAVERSSGQCNVYELVISFEPGQPGHAYCSAEPSSTGFPAFLSGIGSSSIAQNDLSLIAAPVPAGQPGILFHAPNQAAIPFFGGPLVQCAGGGLVRTAPRVATAGGVLSIPIDNTAEATIFQGATRYFQAWFRDPTGAIAFNLSTGYCVTFTE